MGEDATEEEKEKGYCELGIDRRIMMSYSKHTWQDNEIITDIKMNNIENGLEAVSADVSDLQSAKIFTPVPKLIDGIDITGHEIIVTISDDIPAGTHETRGTSTTTETAIPCMFYNNNLTTNDLLNYDYIYSSSYYSRPLLIMPMSFYAVADPEPGEYYLNTDINGVMVAGYMNLFNSSRMMTVIGLPANADIRLAESSGGDTNEDDGGDDSGGGNGTFT